jgi:GNAT superfamily N-acetyltransferase
VVLTVRIVPLAQHLGLAATLARWHHAEWSHLYAEWTLERCLGELEAQNDPERLPTTLVALEGEKLLGSVSLVLDDLPGREELSPWLASLYVPPEQRSRGVGGALLDAAVAEARRLGVERLYLFTPRHEAYYAARGWHVFERTSTAGQPIVIMWR